MDQTLTGLVNTTSGSYSRSAVNRKLRRKRGGGEGEGGRCGDTSIRTLCYKEIRSPKMQDRLVILSLTGLFVFQVTSCDRQSFKGFIFSLGEYTT